MILKRACWCLSGEGEVCLAVKSIETPGVWIIRSESGRCWTITGGTIKHPNQIIHRELMPLSPRDRINVVEGRLDKLLDRAKFLSHSFSEATRLVEMQKHLRSL